MPTRLRRLRPHPGQQQLLLPCDECGTWWGSRQALAVHRWRAHGIHSTQPRAVRKRRQLQREAADELGLPPPQHRCEICGEEFHRRADLSSHRRRLNHYLPGQDH